MKNPVKGDENKETAMDRKVETLIRAFVEIKYIFLGGLDR
jgi:hypothetical protein